MIGLLAMPSAIFIAQIGHDERGCIAVFTASLVVFYLGYLLVRAGRSVK